MKKILIALLVSATPILYAESWQHMHTFPSNQYTHILFNGAEYLCMQGFSTITKSSDLLAWQNPSDVSAPDSLYETDMTGGVFISLLETTTLTNGNFVSIVKKHEFPALGNTDVSSTLSLLSTNGSDWDKMATVDSYYPGLYASAGLNTFDNTLVYAHITGPIGFTIGLPVYCDIYTYNIAMNQWTNTFEIDGWPTDSFYLFQDQQASYFSFPSYSNIGTYQTLHSKDGSDWHALGNGSSYITPADAHDGLIISETQVFSTGGGWETAPYSDVKDIIFNGNRLAGIRGEYLIYSDDFGLTIHQMHVPNLVEAKIIEANEKYVALISTSTNSSIYTLDAYPSRATVTKIQGFGATADGLNFQSTSNGLYQLECTASLIDPDWKAYGLPKVGTGENVTIDSSKNLTSNIFFRVRAINN